MRQLGDPVFSLLGQMPDAERARFLAIARRRQFHKGEIVFLNGDNGDCVHLVVSGHFSVRLTAPMGDEAILSLVGPGSFFGEMALVQEHGRRSATVTALRKAETLAIFREDFAQLRHEYPAVNQVLVTALAMRVQELSELLVQGLYSPVAPRVYRRLLEAAAMWSEVRPGVVVPLTQEETAELAGAARPTVNRVLRQAEQDGLLEILHGGVRLLRPDELERQSRLG